MLLQRLSHLSWGFGCRDYLGGGHNRRASASSLAQTGLAKAGRSLNAKLEECSAAGAERVGDFVLHGQSLSGDLASSSPAAR